ncbi:hypothetical protein Acr_01g0008590 [Actinidia rufa]|uniref:Uncharacterized protein n=1 Tax=Actinidia rufa TaxID=165716 RepID=A0A7J0E3Q6_9ERIC|nr:hypothetical protein Acr_01g0008590 [Actinidia rufa]
MNENNARLIQYITMNNPPFAVAPVQEEANRSRHSHRSVGHDSQSRQSTGQTHSTRSLHHRSPSLHFRQEISPILSESQSSSQTPDTDGEETKRRGRSPRRDDRALNIEISLPPTRSKTWTPGLTPSTPIDLPDRIYGDNRPTVGDIQIIHRGFGLGRCSSSSRKRHAREVSGRTKEEVYNFSVPLLRAHQPITFTNDDLRGLHLPHDDALVVSATIANFNVQMILIDNGSSANILFISVFDKMKIGRDRLHPFHTLLVEFGGSSTDLLEWIKLPLTLGMSLTRPQCGRILLLWTAQCLTMRSLVAQR